MRRNIFVFLSAVFFPSLALAHEVYVLDPATAARDIAMQSPNPLTMIVAHQGLFLLWAFIGFVVVSTAFFASISHRMEKIFDPFLMRLKPLAQPLARITLGTCLIASAYNFAFAGPELSLADFGAIGPLIQIALYISGVCILLGLYTRIAAFIALCIFLEAIAHYGVYMLTYVSYLGEIILALILGSGAFSLSRLLRIRAPLHLPFFKRLARGLEPYAFLILRVLFGISVAFASFYAKFLHSQLALDTVINYHLTNYFHFEPLFVVLGACIIELTIGFFFIIGFEIRHTVLFFLFWLFLSLLYFGEAVWPHVVFLGVLLALFCHGYDKYSFEGYFFSKYKREPVL